MKLLNKSSFILVTTLLIILFIGGVVSYLILKSITEKEINPFCKPIATVVIAAIKIGKLCIIFHQVIVFFIIGFSSKYFSIVVKLIISNMSDSDITKENGNLKSNFYEK